MAVRSHETHKKVACKADKAVAARQRVKCPHCEQPILKNNIHDYYRKHTRNEATLGFLDASPVLGDNEDDDELED